MKKSQCPEASVEEIVKLDWKVPTDIDAHKDYFKISDLLGDIANKLKAEGKNKLSDSVRLIAMISSLVLKSADREESYTLQSNLGNGMRTLSLDDLVEEDIPIIKEVLSRTTSFALKARLADILWIKEKPPKVENAQTALDNYTLLAKQFREPTPDFDKLIYAHYFLQRAAYLQRMINNDENNFKSFAYFD